VGAAVNPLENGIVAAAGRCIEPAGQNNPFIEVIE
jgi:hypothetical protein